MKPLAVVPTYQEANNISELLRRLRASAPEVHVLVVDDNSPDGTADLAEAIAKELNLIEVLRRPEKDGLGNAYKAGFRWGLQHQFDVLIEIDADLSHDPAELPKLLSALEAGAELAIGSRYIKGGSSPGWSWFRRLVSRLGNWYAGVVLGIGIKDATSGYRAFKGSLISSVGLDSVRAQGFVFQIEMAYLARKHRAVITEVPITFVERTSGSSKMSMKIVIEGLLLVTWWAMRDRLLFWRKGS